MSILRMYYSAADAQRPTHYREAWWEEDVGEFVLHHGKVGETGTTKVENISDAEQADALLATFAEQNAADDYVDAHDVVQENFTIKIKLKGAEPTQVESSNAEKFAVELTALLAWRGLGTVEDWNTAADEPAFQFNVSAIHRSKAMKLAPNALKKTDFRANRMRIERN